MVKRNAALALLAFVALWPLAHRGLVARTGMDPWKLGGFAMYASPTFPVLVGVFVPQEGSLALLEESSLPAEARAVLERFRTQRAALGRLREPTDVARAVLAVRSEIPAVTIVVQRTALDPRSARTVTSRQLYGYERSLFAP